MGQKAIKVTAPGVASLVNDAAIPRLRDGYIVAKTKAVALNPTDHSHATFLGAPGVTLGCDWSGVVQEVGKNVTRFKPGDEVFGVCHGGNMREFEDGAFAEVIVAKEASTTHKPKHLSFVEVATLGAGMATAGQILYHVLQLPLPSSDGVGPENRGALLVYGASSASGTILTQLAKLAGFTVYATCSAPNFELVRSRGVDHVFDYNAPDFERDIKKTQESNGHSFKIVIDCLGRQDTATTCADLISTEDSIYHSVRMPIPEEFKRIRSEESVKATTALTYLLSGDPVSFPNGMEFPADPAQEAMAKKFAVIFEDLVAKDKLKPHPPVVVDGGLGAITGLLDHIAQGGTRGKKTVVTIA